MHAKLPAVALALACLMLPGGTGAVSPPGIDLAGPALPEGRDSRTGCVNVVINYVCATAVVMPTVTCERYARNNGFIQGVRCSGRSDGGGGGHSSVPALGGGSASWRLESSCTADCSDTKFTTGRCIWTGDTSCATRAGVAHPMVQREALFNTRVCITYGVRSETTTSASNLLTASVDQLSASARDVHDTTMTMCNI